MAELDRFEARLAAALDRYADEVPERHGLDEFAESVTARRQRNGLLGRLTGPGAAPAGFGTSRPAFRVAWLGVAWLLLLTVLLATILAGIAIVGALRQQHNIFVKVPETTAAPVAIDPAHIGDELIAAWNAGDGQQAASLYNFPQKPTAPVARLFVDSSSGDVTNSYVTASNIADGVASWHANSWVLARNGDVLTQGPFVAFPVSGTSPDGSSNGSFDGVEVLRLSSNDRVAGQYLIGATASPASGSAPPVDAAQLVDELRDAQNASDGSAASALLAPYVYRWVFRDGAQHSGDAQHIGPVGRAGIISGIDQGTACCETNTSTALSQGPFIVHTTILTNPTLLPSGKEAEGVEVLKVDGDGQIENIWRIDGLIDQASSSPAPTPTATRPTNPTAVASALIDAWNGGDGQRAASLYQVAQRPIAPIVQFRIDSGESTSTDTLASNIADDVTAWHDKGFTVTRTGDLMQQGSYTAFPVTWTASGRTFEGVMVIRITADGFVTEHQLIGAATSGQTGALTPADETRIADAERAAASAVDESALTAFFDPNAERYDTQNGAPNEDALGRASVVSTIIGCPCTTTRTGNMETQGPFVVYPAFDTKPTGESRDGFTILELGPDGLIRYLWQVRERALVNVLTGGASDPPAPTASGG